MNAVSRPFRHRRPTDAVSTLFDVFADGTKRDQAKRKLNEDCRRPFSGENVSLMISLVLGVDKKRTRVYDEFAKRVESVRFSSLERDRADIGRVKWATRLRSNDAHLHTQPRSANQSFIRRPCVERAQIPRFATDFNATYIRTKPRA